MKPSLPAPFAPRPDAPPTLDSDLDAVASGDLAAIGRILASTGRLVARGDIAAAQSTSAARRAFVEGLLDPLDDPRTLSDAEILELLRLLSSATLSDADISRCVRALTVALNQPALWDLLFWPKAPLTDGQLLELARTRRGKDLAPFLSPECDVPAETLPREPSLRALAAARTALMELAMNEAIELAFGEMAAHDLALALEDAPAPDLLPACLLEAQGVSEVLAYDAALLEVLVPAWRNATSPPRALTVAPD